MLKIELPITMSNSTHPILKLLRRKQNDDNKHFQQLQKNVILVFQQIFEPQRNEPKMNSFREKIDNLLDDYSFTINNLGLELFSRINNYLQNGDHHARSGIGNRKEIPFVACEGIISLCEGQNLKRKTHDKSVN